MAVGMLACPVAQTAGRSGLAHVAVPRINARLRAAAPVERDIVPEVLPGEDGGYAVSLRDGDVELLSATADVLTLPKPPRPGVVLSRPPEEHAADVKRLAATLVPSSRPWFEETGEHPIPGCFSCGPENARGLHVYPRVVQDGVTCAPWRPAGDFDNGDGTLSPAVIGAAIDCASGISLPVKDQRELLDNDQFYLLGSFDIRYLRLAPSSGAYRIAARCLGREGRKFYGLSVLAGEDGTPYAMAYAIWIIPAATRAVAFAGR